MIALAAGVAEGTILRAFPDKESLLDAVVEILQRRVADIWRLAATIGVRTVPPGRRTPSDLVGLIALFESERDAIDRDPAIAARMLRGLTLAFSHLLPLRPLRSKDKES